MGNQRSPKRRRAHNKSQKENYYPTTQQENDSKSKDIPWWFRFFIFALIFVVFGALVVLAKELNPPELPMLTDTSTYTQSPTLTLTFTSTNISTYTNTATAINTSTDIPPIPTIDINYEGILNITIVRTRLICGSQSPIPYALIELLPEGGEYPYIYETQTGPNDKKQKLLVQNQTIIIKVENKKPVTLRIKSNTHILSSKWDWEGDINIPLSGIICPQSTNTQKPSETNPDIITVSYTPTGSVTVTPTTITPKPTTITPAPTTITPAPPSAKQCSDGIDNDGDNLVDYPADPQCTDANDNKEKN